MKEIIDQGAHFAVAFIAILIALATGPLGCMFAGFVLGLQREIPQRQAELDYDRVDWFIIERSIRRGWLDLLFWTSGGFAAGLVYG